MSDPIYVRIGLEDAGLFGGMRVEGASEGLIPASFCSSQLELGTRIENRADLAVESALQGWPFSDGRRWALVLLDLRFTSGEKNSWGEPIGVDSDDAFGLSILRALRDRLPELPVVVLSSRDRGEVIEACRRLGAADFIQRNTAAPEDTPAELLRAKLREFGLLEDERGIIVGNSVPILKALAAARRSATGGGNILLTGETGTGKELFARYIHDSSPKANGPFRVFHAFGTAETLQEDLLFGHVKGAFTDARSERPGLFEEASGGTLFIDEVGDIAESLQEKLLRPLETRVVVRQGSVEERAVDVQVVLATNKQLETAASRGQFRSDLLNRIKAYPITIPPLRERRDDVPQVANRLLELLCREHRARWPRNFTPDALRLLAMHDWEEGNVRELRNALERAVKDNKDAELVVATDLHVAPDRGESRKPSGLAEVRTEKVLRDARSHWFELLRTIEPPSEYASLVGSWPSLRREVARLFARYLVGAIRLTQVRHPEDLEGRPNLAGAVSCIEGHRVTTAQAADLVKKMLSFDEGMLAELGESGEELRLALEAALRSRPKRPRRKIGRTT